MLKLSSYLGNPYIGVYCVANESLALVPFDAPDSMISDIAEALECEVVKTTLASTNILGALAAMNSNGGIASGMASLTEIRPSGRSFLLLASRTNSTPAGTTFLSMTTRRW